MEFGPCAATFLLNSAEKMVMHYYTLLSGARAELVQLKDDFLFMKEFVKDMNGLPEGWLRQVRDVVYDAEDIIASCAAQVAAEKNKGSLSICCNAGMGINLAGEVQAFRQGRMKSVFHRDRLEFIKLLQQHKSDTPFKESSTNCSKDPRQDNIIPLEVETRNLINLISDHEITSDQQVFPIVGMAGLGKSTMAWTIFRDPKIDEQFPILIWVNVSQIFDKHDVLHTIHTKLIERCPEIGQPTILEELSTFVSNFLSMGRFLIIFDDVWTNNAWDEIRKFLPLQKNKQGRVLITTRHSDLARYSTFSSYSTKRTIEYLRFLNDDESWNLLQLEVFGKLDVCPPQLRISEEHIARYCQGLPFAIVVIGGVLRVIWETAQSTWRAREEWERICRSVGNYPNDNIYNKLRYLISLSYNQLSGGLKECFLYLGMFPEGTEIPARKLTRLWIAEGFILKRENFSFDETAQACLKELVDKNLLMIEKAKPDGSIKACRVHNLVREFCKHEGASSFVEVELSHEGILEPKMEELKDCRRICIHSSLEMFLQKKPKIKKARSFLSFSKYTLLWDDNKVKLPSMTKTFKVLRVLEVHKAINFHKFPYDLAKLVLLKYVTLSGHEFKVLPKDVYKLWNVQTLEVYTSSPVLKIKANIWKMEHLRHFKTKSSIVLSRKLLKEGGEGEDGENLHTLNRLSPESCTSQVFIRKAKNLKALGISGDLSQLFLDDLDCNSSRSSCIDKLAYLEKLKLLHCSPHKQTKVTPLGGLPSCEWFPKKLKILVISGTNLQWSEMSTLGQIKDLQVLKLKDNAFVGGRWDVVGDSFIGLQSLHISDTDLAVWTATKDCFSNLEGLVLRMCKQLSGIPKHFALQSLHLDGVTRSLVSYAKKLDNRLKLVIVPREDDIVI